VLVNMVKLPRAGDDRAAAFITDWSAPRRPTGKVYLIYLLTTQKLCVIITVITIFAAEKTAEMRVEQIHLLVFVAATSVSAVVFVLGTAVLSIFIVFALKSLFTVIVDAIAFIAELIVAVVAAITSGTAASHL